MLDVQKLDRHLTKAIRQLRIPESLLFLNLLLAVSRCEIGEPRLKAVLDRMPGGLPPFVIHLIVKHLMRHGRMNTPIALDGSNFMPVLDAAFQLGIADPLNDSTDESVHGYFVRMASQQMKRRITAQSYGLAIGLFQDLDAITGPKPIDLRKEVEVTLGMSIEMFMRIGQAAHAATCAPPIGPHKLRGTLDVGWLTKAAEDIPGIPWVEKWPDFARVAANDQRGFNADVDRIQLPLEYAAYGLSPLKRRPLFQVAAGRYIAVDPWLVVERTSWGVFYDIFEKHQEGQGINTFMNAFGFAFERFVDNLLQSVIPADALWREAESPRAAQIKGSGKKAHQVGDLAYRSRTNPVLIECAALRPKRELLVMAKKEDLDKAADRVADEVRQTLDHIRAIQTNAWADENLVPGPWVGLVVTFGRYESINWIFFRKAIDERVRAKLGEVSTPYVVLSLEELDAVIHLVEAGKDFGALIAEFSREPSFDPVGGRYESELRKDAVSSFAKARCERMFNFLPDEPGGWRK